jgi:hypothetical protein
VQVFIEPDVVIGLAQEMRETFGDRFIDAAVTDEDAAHEFSGCRAHYSPHLHILRGAG